MIFLNISGSKKDLFLHTPFTHWRNIIAGNKDLVSWYYTLRILQIIVLLSNYCFNLNYFELYTWFCYKFSMWVMTKPTCSTGSTIRTGEGMVLLLLCFSCRTYYKMCICNYIMYYNTFILWQVPYPIGCLTLYGLTECITNEWMCIYIYIYTHIYYMCVCVCACARARVCVLMCAVLLGWLLWCAFTQFWEYFS
jgi:hypothetical protein